MNLFVSLLPVLFQLFFGLKDRSQTTISLKLPVKAPMMVCDRRSDSLELVKFYNATGGPNWWKKWDLKKPMNSWFGIELNTEGCIKSIFLNDTTLSEPILGHSGNNMIGSFISMNLPNLKDLNLWNNHLLGNLSDIENLKSIEFLNIFGNQFTGFIPNFDLLNLKHLNISKNNLTGSIPNFNNLPMLEYLEIAYTPITGSIPDFDLPSLKHLTLQYNQLTGSIPNFTGVPNLESIEAYNNQLTGALPNFNKIPNFIALNMGSNKISGTIPNFDKIPNLKALLIGGNQLKGTIPDFDKLPNLTDVNLADNQLTGPLPGFLKSPNLTQIVVNINNLSGNIPNYYASHPNLNNLLFDNNRYTFKHFISNLNKNKTVIDSIRYAPQQKVYSDTIITISPNTNYTLDLLIDDTVTTSTYTWFKNDVFYKTIKGSNKLPFTPFTSNDAGTYTVKITNPLAPQLTLESWPIRLMTAPQLLCDRRSDSLELVNFYNSTGKEKWKEKWDLSKPMEKWYGLKLNLEGCVQILNLDDNLLEGNIPILNLPYLDQLSLYQNQLVGDIPSFDKLPNLVYLSLARNPLTGPVPKFDKNPNLRNLALNNCNLSGPIPKFDKIPFLKLLSLNNNGLTGEIQNFDNLILIEHINLEQNQLTGNIPSFDKLLKLSLLNISQNQLIGSLHNNTQTNPLLGEYHIYDNKLTFSGLIKNLKSVKDLIETNNINSTLNYAPQKKIYSDTTITIPANTNYTLDLLIDDTVTTGTYTWYKDGMLDTIIKGKNKLPFAPFTSNDAGTYTVKITNPLAPQLTLESWPIRLVSNCHPFASIDIFGYNANPYCINDSPDGLGVSFRFINVFDVPSRAKWSGVGVTPFKFSPSLAGPGNHLVTVTYNDNGCIVSDSVILTVETPDTITISKQNATICEAISKNQFELLIKTQNVILPVKLFYTFDNNKLSEISISSNNYTLEISKDIKFESLRIDSALSAHGCKLFLASPANNLVFQNERILLLNDDLKVKLNSAQIFDVLTNDTITRTIPINITIDQPQNGRIIYSQSNGRGTYTPNENFSGKEVLNYTVCVNGCPNACKSSTITFEVEVPCGDRNSLVLPNIIFPTGSGANRFFIVEAITKCPNSWGVKPHKLQVFNRWGDLVYRNDNYLNDWAGTNTAGQPLPEGTYYYLLDLGSVAAPIKGYVAIVR